MSSNSTTANNHVIDNAKPTWGAWFKNSAHASWTSATGKMYAIGAFAGDKARASGQFIAKNISYKASAVALPIFTVLLVTTKKVPSIVKAHPIASGVAFVVVELFFIYKHLQGASKRNVEFALKLAQKDDQQVDALLGKINSVEKIGNLTDAQKANLLTFKNSCTEVQDLLSNTNGQHLGMIQKLETLSRALGPKKVLDSNQKEELNRILTHLQSDDKNSIKNKIKAVQEGLTKLPLPPKSDE